MPDYSVRLEDDVVVFTNRRQPEPVIEALTTAMVRLSPDAHSQAREAAPGWDVYALEQEWRDWMADGGLDAPANPDKAFLGFCRKVFERRGRP